MKIVSWNVNGVRAVVKKDFGDSLSIMKPDILCLQETKAQDDQVEKALEPLSDYYIFPNSAERKWYSGTAILSKKKPVNIQNDMGVKIHDQEGRVIAAEYDKFYLVTVYVPNSGRGLVRLDYRKKWDADFRKYLTNLGKHKPVIVCGDLNVAHQPIDLAHPKPNYNKTAGYTQQEIDEFTKLLDSGFVDTFRRMYPERIEYSWWSVVTNARAKNVGWRIDYFLVSEMLMKSVKESSMHTDIFGSDHCPVALDIKI
jgi:exodeoxyribonuclease-3